MQIRNIFAGYRDLAAFGRGGETVETAAGRSPENSERAASSERPVAALAEILSRYDVTDISPTEFSEMTQRLYDAGTISEEELQRLAAIRHDLDIEGVEGDESIDLLEFYARKIERTQRTMTDSEDSPAAGRQLGPLLNRLDWVEKFALIQSAPDAIGLDALA
ncbi:MAG TPA: hypothetical protein VMY42_02895 [Thermoguttaceae bacterium]|nr:hypothetical protein [Thermoguttaceae bacterium]